MERGDGRRLPEGGGESEMAEMVSGSLEEGAGENIAGPCVFLRSCRWT